MRVQLPASLLTKLREHRGKRQLDDVMEEYDAFLLDPGLGSPTYLTADGRILSDGRVWDESEVREATENQAIASLVIGAKNTGILELLDLIPAQSAGSQLCTRCRGTRWSQLGPGTNGKPLIVVCVDCSGRGWIPRSIGGHLAKLTWIALWSFLLTFLTVFLVGTSLGAVSWYFLREHYWAYGAAAFLVALVESVVIAYVLGTKNALARSAIYGLESLRLGRLLVHAVFERIIPVPVEGEVGERGGVIARGLERLPLAQAENMLTAAVQSMTGDHEERGWLRRKMHSQLLRIVGYYTMVHFRQENAQHGGVDLLKVRKELEDNLDDLIVKKAQSASRLWTILVFVGLPAVIAVQTFLLALWLQSQS